ncbi:hypothetical protein [Spirulina sp. 06S082]|uniref:hypothetical protein n=1 Tax=Spirulina sp. 06S082 TaxID=3110248 RepID=UPI002B21FA25|nr:hypothetical protein [Spirulina sp. 06S082]MEA5467998.1 hypothetical protein [Spirulina sp. 06S082]
MQTPTQRLHRYLEYTAIAKQIEKLEKKQEDILFEIAREANLPLCLCDRDGEKRLRMNWRSTTRRHVRHIRQIYPHLFKS